MKAKRWTLGVVLAAAVSLFGLIQADASPFSTYILTDDLGNQVNGTAPEQSEWETDMGSDTDDGGDADSGGSDSGGSTDSGDEPGNDNNGHGNNEDGVDSSNKGQGQGGPTGGVDESCDGTGECVDDESKGGGAAPSKGKTK